MCDVHGCIAGTICVRIAMFPLVILGQRNAAEMHNHMPTIQRLQQRMSAARRAGDLKGCQYDISSLLPSVFITCVYSMDVNSSDFSFPDWHSEFTGLAQVLSGIASLLYLGTKVQQRCLVGLYRLTQGHLSM